MGVHVDVERQLPIGLCGLEVGADRDPGIGEEEVDRTERGFGRGDQLAVARFGADVDGKLDRAVRPIAIQLLDDGCQPVRFAVGGDDSGTLGMEPPSERPADAVRRAGHNNVASVEFHSRRW